MAGTSGVNAADFEKALQIGRPPNIVKLFPNSRALIVSGKFIDSALLAKGNAITMAANGRSSFVIRGALKAAQRANAALIVEIAKSEGGANAYCAINYWNIARTVDAFCNELGITIPVAIHADHYGFSMRASPLSPSMHPICRTTKTCWAIWNSTLSYRHGPDSKRKLVKSKAKKVCQPWRKPYS